HIRGEADDRATVCTVLLGVYDLDRLPELQVVAMRAVPEGGLAGDLAVAVVARVGVDRQDRVRLLIIGGIAEQRGGPQRAERPRSRLAVGVLPHGDEHMPEGQAVAVDGHLSGVEPGPLPEVPLRGRGGSGLSATLARTGAERID